MYILTSLADKLPCISVNSIMGKKSAIFEEKNKRQGKKLNFFYLMQKACGVKVNTWTYWHLNLSIFNLPVAF